MNSINVSIEKGIKQTNQEKFLGKKIKRFKNTLKPINKHNAKKPPELSLSTLLQIEKVTKSTKIKNENSANISIYKEKDPPKFKLPELSLKEQYQDLIGRKVVVVKNLKPIKLRGEESKGMLLCASNDDDSKLELIKIDGLNPGDKIS